MTPYESWQVVNPPTLRSGLYEAALACALTVCTLIRAAWRRVR